MSYETGNWWGLLHKLDAECVQLSVAFHSVMWYNLQLSEPNQRLDQIHLYFSTLSMALASDDIRWQVRRCMLSPWASQPLEIASRSLQVSIAIACCFRSEVCFWHRFSAKLTVLLCVSSPSQLQAVQLPALCTAHHPLQHRRLRQWLCS